MLRPGCIAPTFNFSATFYGTLLFVALAYASFVFACIVRRQSLLGRMRVKYLLDQHRHAELVRQASANIQASSGSSAAVDSDANRAVAMQKLEADSKQREQIQKQKQERDEKKINIDFRRRTIHASLILVSLLKRCPTIKFHVLRAAFTDAPWLPLLAFLCS